MNVNPYTLQFDSNGWLWDGDEKTNPENQRWHVSNINPDWIRALQRRLADDSVSDAMRERIFAEARRDGDEAIARRLGWEPVRESPEYDGPSRSGFDRQPLGGRRRRHGDGDMGEGEGGRFASLGEPSGGQRGTQTEGEEGASDPSAPPESAAPEENSAATESGQPVTTGRHKLKPRRGMQAEPDKMFENKSLGDSDDIDIEDFDIEKQKMAMARIEAQRRNERENHIMEAETEMENQRTLDMAIEASIRPQDQDSSAAQDPAVTTTANSLETQIQKSPTPRVPPVATTAFPGLFENWGQYLDPDGVLIGAAKSRKERQKRTKESLLTCSKSRWGYWIRVIESDYRPGILGWAPLMRQWFRERWGHEFGAVSPLHSQAHTVQPPATQAPAVASATTTSFNALNETAEVAASLPTWGTVPSFGTKLTSSVRNQEKEDETSKELMEFLDQLWTEAQWAEAIKNANPSGKFASLAAAEVAKEYYKKRWGRSFELNRRFRDVDLESARTVDGVQGIPPPVTQTSFVPPSATTAPKVPARSANRTVPAPANAGLDLDSRRQRKLEESKKEIKETLNRLATESARANAIRDAENNAKVSGRVKAKGMKELYLQKWGHSYASPPAGTTAGNLGSENGMANLTADTTTSEKDSGDNARSSSSSSTSDTASPLKRKLPGQCPSQPPCKRYKAHLPVDRYTYALSRPIHLRFRIFATYSPDFANWLGIVANRLGIAGWAQYDGTFVGRQNLFWADVQGRMEELLEFHRVVYRDPVGDYAGEMEEVKVEMVETSGSTCIGTGHGVRVVDGATGFEVKDNNVQLNFT